MSADRLRAQIGRAVSTLSESTATSARAPGAAAASAATAASASARKLPPRRRLLEQRRAPEPPQALPLPPPPKPPLPLDRVVELLPALPLLPLSMPPSLLLPPLSWVPSRWLRKCVGKWLVCCAWPTLAPLQLGPKPPVCEQPHAMPGGCSSGCQAAVACRDHDSRVGWWVHAMLLTRHAWRWARLHGDACSPPERAQQHRARSSTSSGGKSGARGAGCAALIKGRPT